MCNLCASPCSFIHLVTVLGTKRTTKAKSLHAQILPLRAIWLEGPRLWMAKEGFSLFVCLFFKYYLLLFLFLVALDLLCCVRTFSGCGKRALFPSCVGFSLWCLLLLLSTGALSTRASVVAAHGLSSWSWKALQHGLSSCPSSRWKLPGPGAEPASSALAGGLSSTVPARKSSPSVPYHSASGLKYCNLPAPWFLDSSPYVQGFPGDSARQCRRLWFHPWVGSIPWRRKWQPNPGFSLGRGAWRAVQSMGLQKSWTWLID